MKYHYQVGVIQSYASAHKRITAALVAGVFAFMWSVALLLQANAAGAVTFNSFTQPELDTWVADRTYPSGDVASVSAEGRDDVAQLGVDASERSDGSSFYHTEGIQKRQDFGSELRADLFVDGDWADINVRAGLWGIGVNDSDAISSYPIIEYVNNDDHEGWRYWNVTGAGGWTTLPDEVSYDEWVSVNIVLDNVNDEYHYYIGGELVAEIPSNGTDRLDGAIFNSFNYAEDDYLVHWHAGVNYVTSADECKKGGWELGVAEMSFRNQGDCVSYFSSQTQMEFNPDGASENNARGRNGR